MPGSKADIEAGADDQELSGVAEPMRMPFALPILALAAACSPEAAVPPEGKRLCSPDEAGAVTAAKAGELLRAVRESAGAGRRAACARFKEVLEDGRNAAIGDAAGCRWDDRKSNGNPRFLISLHLTQLKGQAGKMCKNLNQVRARARSADEY